MYKSSTINISINCHLYKASSQARPVVLKTLSNGVVPISSSYVQSSNRLREFHRSASLKKKPAVLPRIQRESTEGLLEQLTSEHQKILKESFASLEEDGMIKNGTYIFLALFSEHPQYKKLFTSFRSVSDAALFGSPVLIRHAGNYMNALKQIIDILGKDDEEVFDVLKRIAATHRRIGVRMYHIEHNIPTVTERIQNCYGSKCTKEVEEAWKILFNVIAVLVEYFKDAT